MLGAQSCLSNISMYMFYVLVYTCINICQFISFYHNYKVDPVLFKFILCLCLSVPLTVCVHISVELPSETRDVRSPGVTLAVSQLTWALGTDLRFSGRGASTLNH